MNLHMTWDSTKIIYFPPVAVVGSPEIWKEEFAYKNSDLIKEINQLRTDILNKVKP